MRRVIHIISICGLLALDACSPAKKLLQKYVPDDAALFATIMQQDSIYFTAYNTCDMATQTAMYDDDIEFYHDNGGLMTSKTDLLESIRKNICGKVSRELIAGSTEVYAIKNFGAVEIGMHRFHNKQENSVSRAGRFVITWQLKDGKWFLKRVISLH